MLKKTVEHLIRESYFKVGTTTLIQRIGIPMGISPAPYWANLYLHMHEYKYMKNKIKENKKHARLFNNNMRFIDDMICINDSGEFGKEYSNIYPESLELKCEYDGLKATFLDLNISIQQGKFTYKLFDKRDNYKFKIIRMPYMTSNIPTRIYYATFMSEMLRIARTTLECGDFTEKSKVLIKRMRAQGGEENMIKKHFKKTLHKHGEIAEKYDVNQEFLIKNILKESK